MGFRGLCWLFALILHKKRQKSCTVNLKCLPLHSLNKKHNGAIAQMVEQRTENPCVPGSIPGGTTLKESFFGVTLFLYTCHSSVGRAKGETRAKHGGCKYVYFASMQDLRGSELVGGNFDKNNDVFATAWDCIIVDEAHEVHRLN